MKNTEVRIRGKPQQDPNEAQGPAAEANATDKPEVEKGLEEKVIDALRSVYDPEIPVNIYELGLIYELNINESNHVSIKMTLTSPACPVAESLPAEVRSKINHIPEVVDCDLELVWDPPWGPDRMSEAAKLTLGMM